MISTKLIINADDFGYSRGINLGIIDAHKDGVLTSTTMMVNMPGTIDAVELMRNCPQLGVGLHLNIALGKPLTDGKSLVDNSGNFMKPSKLPPDHKYDLDELIRELEAQYRMFLTMTRQKPTHIDSHLFTSDKIPEMVHMSKKLAEKYGIPLRNQETTKFRRVEFITHRSFNAPPGLQYVLDCFGDIIRYEYAEIMSHPGYIDTQLLNNSSYTLARAEELQLLTSMEMKQLMQKHNVKLITYREISAK